MLAGHGCGRSMLDVSSPVVAAAEPDTHPEDEPPSADGEPDAMKRFTLLPLTAAGGKSPRPLIIVGHSEETSPIGAERTSVR